MAHNYITDSRCVAGYLFKEGSGTTTADGSGNGNTGTFDSSGHPAWSSNVPVFATSGSAANSVLYASGDFIGCGSGSNIANISPMTLAVCVYYNATPSSSSRILDKFQTNGWLFDANASGSTAMQFAVEYSTTELVVVTSTAPSINTWHSLVVTWDGSSTATNVHIYVDNVECSYTTQTNGSGSRNNDSASILTIGNRESDEGRAFPGYITNVGIFNAVLSLSDISSIYNYGIGGSSYLNRNLLLGVG